MPHFCILTHDVELAALFLFQFFGLQCACISSSGSLTNDNLSIFREVVAGHLKVERSGALSYASRDVVVRTVAGAEPAAEVASLADGNTTEMGADTWVKLAMFASVCALLVQMSVYQA